MELKRVYLHYHIALNGLPEEVTDSQGRIIWHGDYSLWGKLKREQHPAPGFRGQQNLRFQGQYFDRETGLHYNTFRYYAPDTGRFTQQDPIGLMGGLNLYQYAPNPVGWVEPWGLACTGKMQPYRFDDVRVKGPHLDISVDGRKITEAKLGLDKSGNLVWERFGDMKGASNKSLNQADKYIGDLMGNQKIMGQAKTQITQTMDDFKRILSDPSSSKNSIGLAERGIDKFSKMLEKFNELN
ncbi:RHS repeat domain-containing protein [Morganella morganii]|uniref:RHS repeat domain-containing protein n=1 Tax=Morganella morganii TaxID=582 RepID=UPI001E48F32F|nr:RHS repeat-associated core domain-containing protein [Morganella morganii]UFH67264.1 RHS domain-containing protein [Morganella morganii]